MVSGAAIKAARCKWGGKDVAASEISRINRELWHNWLLLGAVALIPTIGLLATTSPLLWPWSATELALLLGLILIVPLLVVRITGRSRALIAECSIIERVRSESIEKRYERVFELLKVGKILGREANPRNVFDGITNLCLKVFECEKASLMLYVPEDDQLEVQSVTGSVKKKVVGATQKVGEGISGWAAKHRKAILLTGKSDLKNYPGLRFKSQGIPSAMVVPIVIRDVLIGVLNISMRSKSVDYDERDLESLEAFAETVGTYIVHLEKSRTMRQTIEEQQRALHEKFMGKTS
jgi:transcriptional regulator with GAF, ATPase, and Fis domain